MYVSECGVRVCDHEREMCMHVGALDLEMLHSIEVGNVNVWLNLLCFIYAGTAMLNPPERKKV